MSIFNLFVNIRKDLGWNTEKRDGIHHLRIMSSTGYEMPTISNS
jgi:hypothetical protein